MYLCLSKSKDLNILTQNYKIITSETSVLNGKIVKIIFMLLENLRHYKNRNIIAYCILDSNK